LSKHQNFEFCGAFQIGGAGLETEYFRKSLKSLFGGQQSLLKVLLLMREQFSVG
jgi:hypothetical protein